MSELYEAIVFSSSEAEAVGAFHALDAPFRMCLVRLAEGVFGVRRVATRSEPFDVPKMIALAEKLSAAGPPALAVFYDNRCGVRVANLVRNGSQAAEFGEQDELWVLVDEQGYPRRDVAPVRAGEMTPSEEYDCVLDAIEAGLAAMGVPSTITRSTLKDAFCYGTLPTLAEGGK